MKSRGKGRLLFVALLVIALAGVCIGAVRVWKSFRDFDEYILSEKDSQFEKLIDSADTSLQNMMNAFERETRSAFGRERLRTAEDQWVLTGDSSGVADVLSNSTIRLNPAFEDILVYRDNKLEGGLSGSHRYDFITEDNDSGFRLCREKAGKYCVAYCYKATKGIKYYTVMSLDKMYAIAIGERNSVDDRTMLMDSGGNILIYKMGEMLRIEKISDISDENIVKCIDFFRTCSEKGEGKGESLELVSGQKETYTARIVVTPGNKTRNGFFAIGITANYDDAVRPSRHAANGILVYGGVAVAGVALLLILFIYTRRRTSIELDNLRKRNETMEEINRKMQNLAHHQRLETIGTMTAGIAHDFNNLLTPIMGYSMMTMEMLPPEYEELQDNLLEVYNSSVKAKDIVSRLADLSKKSDEDTFKLLDPDELIENSLKVTLPAKPKSVEVKISMNCADRRIRGDETQVSQLVMNMVLNAYDAMEEQGGTLLVSTEYNSDSVIMRFRDNGPGMDAETVSRIFDPFYTTKESGKGTGLGLAIVAQIADTHNARIYVDSMPGEGTEFRINFPVDGKNDAV